MDQSRNTVPRAILHLETDGQWGVNELATLLRNIELSFVYLSILQLSEQEINELQRVEGDRLSYRAERPIPEISEREEVIVDVYEDGASAILPSVRRYIVRKSGHLVIRRIQIASPGVIEIVAVTLTALRASVPIFRIIADSIVAFRKENTLRELNRSRSDLETRKIESDEIIKSWKTLSRLLELGDIDGFDFQNRVRSHGVDRAGRILKRTSDNTKVVDASSQVEAATQ